MCVQRSARKSQLVVRKCRSCEFAAAESCTQTDTNCSFPERLQSYFTRQQSMCGWVGVKAESQGVNGRFSRRRGQTGRPRATKGHLRSNGSRCDEEDSSGKSTSTTFVLVPRTTNSAAAASLSLSESVPVSVSSLPPHPPSLSLSRSLIDCAGTKIQATSRSSSQARWASRATASDTRPGPALSSNVQPVVRHKKPQSQNILSQECGLLYVILQAARHAKHLSHLTECISFSLPLRIMFTA